MKKQNPLVRIVIVLGMWATISALIYGFATGAIINTLGVPLLGSIVTGGVIVAILVIAAEGKGAR